MTLVYFVLVLFIAGLGAFTDISSGCVRNKHLIVALVLWVMLAVTEAFLFHSSPVNILSITLNAILSVVTAIIFYITDIWAPGDCKLYIVISLIFPMQAYVVREGNIFPALDFVVYAFAVGYVFLLTTTLTRKTAKKINLRPNFSLKHYFSILANAGTISFLNVLLNTCAPEFFYANQVLCVLSFATLTFILQKKANTAKKIIGFTGIVYILIQSILSGSWISTCMSLTVSLIVASIIEYISRRGRANTYREISGDEVRPGMILSLSSLWAMRKCTDPELPTTTTENRRLRLTQRQAEAVKTWCGNAHSNIMIVEMMPFAPFIAGAAVIQVLRFLLLQR